MPVSGHFKFLPEATDTCECWDYVDDENKVACTWPTSQQSRDLEAPNTGMYMHVDSSVAALQSFISSAAVHVLREGFCSAQMGSGARTLKAYDATRLFAGGHID